MAAIPVSCLCYFLFLLMDITIVSAQLPDGTDVCSILESQKATCDCSPNGNNLEVDCERKNFDEIPMEIPFNTEILYVTLCTFLMINNVENPKCPPYASYA